MRKMLFYSFYFVFICLMITACSDKPSHINNKDKALPDKIHLVPRDHVLYPQHALIKKSGINYDGYTFVSVDMGDEKMKAIVFVWPLGPASVFKFKSKNLHSMTDSNIRTVFKSLLDDLKGNGISLDSSIVLIDGAGFDEKRDSARFPEILKSAGFPSGKVIVYPDGITNLASALGGKDGMICMNGNGSVILGIRDGRIMTEHGYGWMIDDIPSRAFVGKIYLKHVLKEMNNKSGSRRYLKNYNINYPELPDTNQELINLLYTSDYPQGFLEQFQKGFEDMYYEGDPSARKYLKDSVDLLIEETMDLYKRLGYTAKVHVGKVGGLWDWNTMDIITAELQTEKAQRSLEFVDEMFPPVWGPFIWFMRTQGQDMSDVTQNIKEMETPTLKHQLLNHED